MRVDDPWSRMQSNMNRESKKFQLPITSLSYRNYVERLAYWVGRIFWTLRWNCRSKRINEAKICHRSEPYMFVYAYFIVNEHVCLSLKPVIPSTIFKTRSASYSCMSAISQHTWETAVLNNQFITTRLYIISNVPADFWHSWQRSLTIFYTVYFEPGTFRGRISLANQKLPDPRRRLRTIHIYHLTRNILLYKYIFIHV